MGILQAFHKPTLLLAKGFVFLGILGNLIPFPVEISNAFRFYYALLPVIILYFIPQPKKNFQLDYIIETLPLFIYFLMSATLASYALFFVHSDAKNLAFNPFVRLGLLYSLFISTIFLSSINSTDVDEKFKLVLLYLKGYFITMIVGFMFMIGQANGWISGEFIAQYTIAATREMSGVRRMSPGSYPNEYAIVSSFALSIITLLLFYRKRLCHEKIVFIKNTSVFFYAMFWLMSITALFFAKTRAAWLAYPVALMYIIFSQRINLFKKIKILLLLFMFFLFFLTFVQRYIGDVFSYFLYAYLSTINATGSLGIRFQLWAQVWQFFKENMILGIGFGNASIIHNTYLQFFCESGYFGVFVLFVTLVLIRQTYLQSKHIIDNPETVKYEILLKVKNIAIIHVFSFAFSNHNLNHHLTWFCILLILITPWKVVENTKIK